nr:uncharacterized protein LOC128689247 [Cherax quadricarinatus]
MIQLLQSFNCGRNKLNDTVTAFTVEDNKLNDTVTVFTVEDNKLNDTVTAFTVEDNKLNDTVTAFTVEDNKLNDTVTAFTVEDNKLNDTVSFRDYVSFLIKRNKRLNDLVADPVLSNILNDSPAPVEESVLSTRFGGDLEQESPVCASKETLIYPKRGKTTKDDWVFVVNQENVQQALRVEKCINEGSSCNFGMPLPGNARAVCRQKYVYRRMLTVASNSIDPEEVLMPSCCVCYARDQTFDISALVRK